MINVFVCESNYDELGIESRGEWFGFPMTEEEFENMVQHFGTTKLIVGDIEEPFTFSYEEDDDYISAYALNQYLNRIQPTETDMRLLGALQEGEDWSLAYLIDCEVSPDSYQFFDEDDMYAVANCLLEEGVYGEVSEALYTYIDFDKLTTDLTYDGYTETSIGVYRPY